MLAGPMPAHDLARRLLAASLLAGVSTIGPVGPAPAAAVRTVPAEVVHPLDSAGPTFAAMVGDVDGDGQRELVRLVPWATNPGQLAVEVVSVAPDGRPRPHGDALLQRGATVEDVSRGRRPDEANLLPVGAREAARLIAWQVGGRERVLAAAMGTVDVPRPCCLTLWAVELDEAGDARLALIGDTSLSGAWVRVADLDDDDTDELVVLETPDPAADGDLRVAVLRWDGTQFRRSFVAAPATASAGPLQSLGDGDGLPGEEVGFVALPRFDGTRPVLHRITLRQGGAQLETAILPSEGEVVPISGADGGRLALLSRLRLQLLEWPSGAIQPAVERTSIRGGTPLGVLGSGDDARLLVRRGPALDVLDATLAGRQGVSPGAAAFHFGPTDPPPYVGPLPGGTGSGAPAFVYRGQLVSAAAGRGELDVREMAVLPGMGPVGLVGPGGGWAVLTGNAGLDTARDGGAMAAGERSDRLVMVPGAQLLAPAAEGGLLEPPLSGAVPGGEPRTRPVLLTAGSVEAEISAPVGSLVHVAVHDPEPRDTTVGSSGQVTVSLDAPGAPRSDGERYVARLVLVTPGGHGYGASWEVRVAREPPALELSAPFAPLTFDVPLEGRSEPLARVEVNGRPVSVAPDGSFTATVAAGALPRTVAARAVDRVGNVNELRLSVVGFVDYRRLPWIPIVAALLLVTMLVLYLRVPRPAAQQRRSSTDEGTFEELP